jgi:hypothetical protein
MAKRPAWKYTGKKISKLLEAAALFYEDHGWGKGALYKKWGGRESFCVLGAISAAACNDSLLRERGIQLGQPESNFKNYDTIRAASNFLARQLDPKLPARHTTNYATVYSWNDNRAGSRQTIINKLKEAAKAAREQGL